MARAACVGMDTRIFFPDAKRRGCYDYEPAKQVCADCPVRTECAHFALSNDERHGVWGGMTPPERRAPQPVAAPLSAPVH